MTKKPKPAYIKAYRPWSLLLFADPFADPLVPVIAATKIHPNIITIFSLLAGIICGFLFAMGYWFAGALIFQFSCFCDGIDGKVARLRNITSEFGAKLDIIADSVRKPSSFLGIAIYFYSHDQFLFVGLTVLALLVHVIVHKLYVIAGILEYDLEFPNFHRNIIRRISPRILALYTFFEEQFIEFVVFPLIAAIVTLPEGGVWFFYGAGAVTILSACKLFIILNHRWKGRYDEVFQDWSGTGGNLDKV